MTEADLSITVESFNLMALQLVLVEASAFNKVCCDITGICWIFVKMLLDFFCW